MRSADIVTAIRVALVFVIGYMIIAKLSAALIVLLFVITFVMDNLDGYLATSRRPSIANFASYINKEARGTETRKDRNALKPPKYGAALDIAGDRITEYVFWIIFTWLNVIPIYVVFIILTRNSLADALTSSKGKTFSKMKSSFGRIASSHISRGLYGAIKALNFIYLSLVFVAGWPIWIGYVLTAVVVAYSLLRGAAEISEALA
ncbi:Uncharacterised protein [uncultured archaeon]|nr:Uncharacterised protein [uncultured archaeon]